MFSIQFASVTQNHYQWIILGFIVALLAYVYVTKNKEKFTNDKKSTECSQKAINDAYQYYIFGTQKFIR